LRALLQSFADFYVNVFDGFGQENLRPAERGAGRTVHIVVKGQ